MNYNKTLALIPTLLLASCGGEEQTMKETLEPGSVVYSYPADGQNGVSPTVDIVLRFSHAISDDEDALSDKILISSDAGGNVGYTVTRVDNGRSLKLEPSTGLEVGTNYQVTFSSPLLASGSQPIGTPNGAGPEGIQFATRGGFTGIAGLDNLASEFAVASMVPSPDGEFRAMDFSSFRLVLTQPVHPQWQAMGGRIVLEDSTGTPVPAEVIVDQRRVTLDPCTTEEALACGSTADELTAGATYTLRVSNLPSLTTPGTTLDFEQSFTVRETGPTVVLFQEVVGSGLLSGQQPRTSKLNGQIINGVTLHSVLQGDAGPSQQTGGLFAELAYAPSFDASEPLPLRIPKGSVLSSSSLDVKINGTVPVLNAETQALQTTGNIKVTMISDASGYLLPNPYTDDLSAPRHVKLFMDVAMNTENAQPNASLTQDLLGVELSGIAIVENGVLTIDAIGIVEPELLGQETTDATIAFRIEAATDADSVLDAEGLRELDTAGPELVSWMPGPDDAAPGDRDQMQRPGDPIVLNFDEPIDEDTLADGLTLDEGGTPLTVANGKLRAYVDGTAVVINPTGGLAHGVDYSLSINGSLTDLAGNSAVSQSLNFALPAIDNGSSELTTASPLALTTYPGFPCVTTGIDLDAGTHGQCVDAAPDGPRGQVLPITTLPEDRPIVVVFSQSMDLATIRKGETFKVEKVNNDGTFSEVAGRLEKNNQRIRFYPDAPWEVGSHYRYTMASVDSLNCSNAICSSKGYPLQTDLLVDPEDIGGPSMAIYFRGTEATDTVFTPLRNLPIRDVNANFVVDCETAGGQSCLEPFDHAPDGQDGFLPSANAAKLTVVGQQATALAVPVGASVGCSASEQCPENKFIYQTYALNTEILGPTTEAGTGKPGVRVLLYPTMLATTSASVFLDGFGEQATGPQILRMTYGEPREGNPLGLVEGIIVEGEDGRPTFKTKTTADLTLDAPNLSLPLASALSHDLYSKEFSLDLEGPIVFFDDGRMQIEQRNSNVPPIDVNVEVEIPLLGGFIDFLQCTSDDNSLAECLSGSGTDAGDINIPLEIPREGVYLNFISNPIKEIPAEQ